MTEHYFLHLNMNRIELGEIIKAARQGAGLTQEQLGEAVHTKKQNISAMEKGRMPIGADMLFKIAEALNCDLIIQFQKR